jgi:uncharacterized protein
MTKGFCLPASLLAATLIALSACGGSVDDPQSARCDSPAATFGEKMVQADHAEVAVRFTCAGDELAGTLAMPKGGGRYPAVVWIAGAGEAPRLTFDDAPLVRQVVKAGLAFFSYDKRGVGESGGTCCPGDSNHFNLLAADADGALNALRSRSEINPVKVGFLGASQAGWVVPLAVSRSRNRIAFTAVADGPATTTHEEEQWSELAGEEADDPPALTKEKKAEITEKLEPSGFDPVPLLERTRVPGIWVYGGQDRSVPSEKSAATLMRLRDNEGKDFKVLVFPDAGHGLLDNPPTDARALPTLLAWIQSRVH